MPRSKNKKSVTSVEESAAKFAQAMVILKVNGIVVLEENGMRAVAGSVDKKTAKRLSRWALRELTILVSGTRKV